MTRRVQTAFGREILRTDAPCRRKRRVSGAVLGAANLPIIPTTTASQWFQNNSQNYVGWPTQDNPYESGQPSGTNNGPGSGTDEVVLIHLRPRA